MNRSQAPSIAVNGAELRVSNLQKLFTASKKQVRAVNNVSFTVRPGEFYTLLGPSGCGKTTTLRIIAGLEHPTGGEVAIDQRIMSDNSSFVPPEKRELGMVFQQYAVWPHMTVFKNVAFPMKVSGTKYSKSEMRRRVQEVLEVVQLTEQIHRPATMLSGGQQQRLALARALVCGPGLLLLDEPLSNLDARLRDRMRMELKRIQQKAGVTAIYVTHDQAEALSMSDRVAVLHSGAIAQEGTPREIYEKPTNPFVAKFVGTTTFLDADVMETHADGRTVVRTPLGVINATNEGHALDIGDQTKISIRPENITLTVRTGTSSGSLAAQEVNRLTGTVKEVVFQGDTVHCAVAVGHERLVVKTHPWNPIAPDEDVDVDIPSRGCVVVRG